MAGGVTTHRIQRSLAALTVNTQKAYQQRHQQQQNISGGEAEQQFKIAVTGEVADVPTFQYADVSFDRSVVPALDRRDSDFTEPAFTYGWEREYGPPMFLTAFIDGWVVDDDGSVTGARIGIGTFMPFATETRQFRAVVHTVFQGWANSDIDDTAGEGD